LSAGAITEPKPQEPDAARALADAKAASQPTSQTTVEAVMWAVRERGLKALREPANQERLGRCDAAARMEINQRIEKLIATGRDVTKVQSNG
jgi:hypothetical protein